MTVAVDFEELHFTYLSRLLKITISDVFNRHYVLLLDLVYCIAVDSSLKLVLSSWITVDYDLIDSLLTRSVTWLPWFFEKIRKEGKTVFYTWIWELKFSKKSVIGGLLPCLGNSIDDFTCYDTFLLLLFIYSYSGLNSFSIIGPAIQFSLCPISGSSLNTLWELCLSMSCIFWVEIMSRTQFCMQFNIIIRSSQHSHVCGQFMWVCFHRLWMLVHLSFSSQ